MSIGLGLGAVALNAQDQQRRALNAQSDALKARQAQDAQQQAMADVQATQLANAKTADAKRRRRASALGAGGDTLLDTLGGPPSALAAPRQTQQARSVLGAGAPATMPVDTYARG